MATYTVFKPQLRHSNTGMHSLAPQLKIHQYVHSKKSSPHYKSRPTECEIHSPTRAPKDPSLIVSPAEP